MPEPIKWKSKIVLAKMETVYGTDPVPTGAANAMLMTDLELRPMEGDTISRNLEQPYLGGQASLQTGIHVVLTGSVELQGSGTLGTPPGWGPLLRMCAVAEVITAATKVEYSPVTDAHESGALYFHIGPTRHIITGARGTAVLTANAQGIPTLRFTLTGLFTTPLDQAAPTIDVSLFKKPDVVSNANTPLFTIGGAAFVYRNFSFDLGNDVQRRFLVGVERIVIVDRAERIGVSVEAVPIATYNPYTIANAGTLQAIALTHGTVAGKRVKLAAAQAEQQRIAGFENNQNVLEWPLAFAPLPTSAGNNQWKITLD
ncbi:MAG: phage tail tube protein [Pseudomonadota bacterium]